MYEHNALGYWSGLALCLTKVRSSRARCPATALIFFFLSVKHTFQDYFSSYELGQLVGGAKTGEPGEKPPDKPAIRTWLICPLWAQTHTTAVR